MAGRMGGDACRDEATGRAMKVVRDLERAGLVEQHAQTCSDGITRTLALMRESVQQVRTRVHAADVQLTAAAEALMAESMLDENKKD